MVGRKTTPSWAILASASDSSEYRDPAVAKQGEAFRVMDVRKASQMQPQRLIRGPADFEERLAKAEGMLLAGGIGHRKCQGQCQARIHRQATVED